MRQTVPTDNAQAGRRQDLAKALVFAAEGKRSVIRRPDLEAINSVVANLRAGTVDSRVVLTI